MLLQNSMLPVSGFRRICAAKRSTIKFASLVCKKLPYILVVGEKEAQTGTVSVRARGGENLGVMSLDAFIERISTENRERTR